MGKCYPDAFLWTRSQFGEVKTTVGQCNKGLQGNTISRRAVQCHPSPACLFSQSQSCHRALAVTLMTQTHLEQSISAFPYPQQKHNQTEMVWLGSHVVSQSRKQRVLPIDVSTFIVLVGQRKKSFLLVLKLLSNLTESFQILVFFFGIPFAVGSLFCLPSG